MFLKNYRNVFLSTFLSISIQHTNFISLCERGVSFCMLANLVAKFIQVNLVHRVGC